MDWNRQAILAPQFGIGKDRLRRGKETPASGNAVIANVRNQTSMPAESTRAQLDQRPASALSVVELVERRWSYRVAGTTKTHATVEFTSPDGSMREERTILRNMLPDPGYSKRPTIHLGKTARDHETGAWKQHLDNKAAHAELNRGYAVDHGAGTKGGGRQNRKGGE